MDETPVPRLRRERHLPGEARLARASLYEPSRLRRRGARPARTDRVRVQQERRASRAQHRRRAERRVRVGWQPLCWTHSLSVLDTQPLPPRAPREM
jgi:hypothetical protein